MEVFSGKSSREERARASTDGGFGSDVPRSSGSWCSEEREVAVSFEAAPLSEIGGKAKSLRQVLAARNVGIGWEIEDSKVHQGPEVRLLEGLER